MAGHAQGAAALAGHAGEPLPAGEVVHRHHVEAHPLPPRRRLLLPEDGGGCRVDTERWETDQAFLLLARSSPGDAALLTGERGAGGRVEAVAAVGAVAAGHVIVRVFDRRERGAVVHLFVSSFEAEGRTFLHGDSVSEGAEAEERRHSAAEDPYPQPRPKAPFQVCLVQALVLLKRIQSTGNCPLQIVRTFIPPIKVYSLKLEALFCAYLYKDGIRMADLSANDGNQADIMKLYCIPTLLSNFSNEPRRSLHHEEHKYEPRF